MGAVALAVFAGALHPAGAEVLGGAGVTVAASPGHPGPEQGRAEELDGLQFGDPAAGIGIIEPPEADSFGEAQLRYPIDIPPGRLGWQPQLGLAYGSGGDNGWMGEGWDLSLDAIRVPGLGSDVSADSIEVDNRWGVPRFDLIGEEPDSLVDDSRLLGAFAYAFDNPTTYIDETGYDGVWVHASPSAKAPGPKHSAVRARVKAFVQDPEIGEKISGLLEAPSLIEIDIAGDGMFGLGLSVVGFDVKHIKHVRKLVRR